MKQVIKFKRSNSWDSFRSGTPYLTWCRSALANFWHLPRMSFPQAVWVVFTSQPVAQSYRVTLNGDFIMHLSGHKQQYDYNAQKLVKEFIRRHGKCYVSVEYVVSGSRKGSEV